ncbi:hypothetical protein EJ04DRAFT_449376 [Polyplosphaeria fusca]|uniref:Elongation factor 1 alpha-like protein n=1 Tax=Polyplosphaeria fusca TaxID=682080 RepID=A0A9P4UWZ3_9PLEO|nr:hypothetical protein EJ04DRAFT_449376 [Polyplosphaeria fusca]
MPPKSGFQRAKTVAYEDDDGYSDDEYYEDEPGGDALADISAEQMRLGTIKVKEALSSTIQPSDAEIQEALWHYYFDVGKSVTYLKNKLEPTRSEAPAQTKKPKATSRFDQAAKVANTTVKNAPGKQIPSLSPFARTQRPLHRYPCSYSPIVLDSSFSSAEYFFWDTPWCNVPPSRLGEITIQPRYPRGGLLGGSSKPSKLAALAAARKKKQEEAKQKPNTNDTKSNIETDQAVALLDKLNVKGKDDSSPSAQHSDSKDPKMNKISQRKYPNRKNSNIPLSLEPEVEEAAGAEPSPALDLPDLRSDPSDFASILCATHNTETERHGPEDFPLTYNSFRGFNPDPFAKPSPDDIVLRAQGKSAIGKTAKNSQPKNANGDSLSQSVSKLSVEESPQTPKVKSKNLNVVEEFEKSNMKRMANFVVIGHVDHGKSTLMGRLLYDLKVVDQRSIDKLRKEAETIGKSSFALAWVMDQTSEERSRGVTVDIATNYFETDKTRFTILDAPGHKDFIPNMIAGASQADFAVLVIDAGTNSFESGLKGQTKEHALLVRSLGVQRLIVAINKMDTVSWSQSRFEEITNQMTAFLTTASFSPKTITFIPCAGLTGENVARKVEDTNAAWYHGETLIQALDSSEPAKRNIEKPLRLTIGDVFRGGILNPVSISGRIDAGSLQAGDTILCMPSAETATVKSLEVENEPVDWAVAGQIATLHLADIDPIHLRLGDIVCTPQSPVKLVKSFGCKILAFEHVMPMGVDVFRGRLQAEGKVKELGALLGKASGEVVKKKPRIVKPGEVARVVVELERELPLEAGVRVVLREGGNTVAAGLIEG